MLLSKRSADWSIQHCNKEMLTDARLSSPFHLCTEESCSRRLPWPLCMAGKKDNKFNGIVAKSYMLSARTQEIRAKEGRSPNSHAHLPLVTRVSRSKSFATCQIKSSARYVGYFKCSQISRVVFFWGGRGLRSQTHLTRIFQTYFACPL